jgi:hypothetical protein
MESEVFATFLGSFSNSQATGRETFYFFTRPLMRKILFIMNLETFK